jgi:hypothetical protein
VDDDEAHAHAEAYYTLFQALPDFPLQPIACGRYKDRFKRQDGRRLCAQKIVRTGLAISVVIGGDRSSTEEPSPIDHVEDDASPRTEQIHDVRASLGKSKSAEKSEKNTEETLA